MGYHIIIAKGSSCETYYIDNLRELAYIDGLPDEALIYEGKETDKPNIFIDYESAKDYHKQSARTGVLGEDLFEKQAKENNFIPTFLDQNQESYISYVESLGTIIKRPDFIVQNTSVDIEVKCLSIYKMPNDCIFLREKEIDLLYNLSKHSNRPIIFAIYKNERNKPLPDRLFMIGVDDIVKKIEEKLLKSTSYDNEISYIIPLSITTPGFKLLEQYRINPIR